MTLHPIPSEFPYMRIIFLSSIISVDMKHTVQYSFHFHTSKTKEESSSPPYDLETFFQIPRHCPFIMTRPSE
jgi:hypothetical protein